MNDEQRPANGFLDGSPLPWREGANENGGQAAADHRLRGQDETRLFSQPQGILELCRFDVAGRFGNKERPTRFQCVVDVREQNIRFGYLMDHRKGQRSTLPA